MATATSTKTTGAGHTQQHHHHQIIVSNPFAHHGHADDDDDDESKNDKSALSSQPHTPTTATPPNLSSQLTPSSGLRAQLHHLLPRHAFFHVQIVVHQITNIPLVTGEFAVKWKFKNVHSLPGCKVGDGRGLFARVRARRRARIEERAEREKSRGRAGEEEDGYGDGEDTVSLGSSEAASQHRASIDGRSTSASLWSGKSSSSSSSSSSHTNTSRTFVHNPSLTASHSLASTTTFATSTTTSNPSVSPSLGMGAGGVAFGTPATATTPAKAQTQFRKLKDHNVTWDHTISLLVRMDVNRDPQSTLMSCPVQLSVLQRQPEAAAPEASHAKDAASSDVSVHGSGNAKHNHHHHNGPRPTRFGVVNLDLAQYACKGEVGRRYLLRESKTNATLKYDLFLVDLPFYVPPQLTTYLTHLPSTNTGSCVSTPTSTTPRPSTPTSTAFFSTSSASGGSPAMFHSNLSRSVLSTPPAHASSFSSSGSSSLHPSSASHLSASSAHSNSHSSSSSTSNSWNSTFSAAATPPTSSATNTFTAPPLPRGEILNGISNILTSGPNPFSPLGPTGENDMYRVRPKGLDLYGPYYDQEELDIDLLGGRRKEGRGKRKGKVKGKERGQDIDEGLDKRKGQGNGKDKDTHTRDRSDSQPRAFDPTRLPLAYGPKTTEALIDALFNPVRQTTHEEGEREGPFVMFVEDEDVDEESGVDSRQRLMTPTAKMLMGSTSPSPTILATSPRSVSAPTPPSLMGSSTATLTPRPAEGLLAPGILLAQSTSVSSKSPRVSPRPAFGGAGSTSPTPKANASSNTSRPSTPRRLSSHNRTGSAGIGAGLGIMGLGMGLGVGLGVGVGVTNGHVGGGEGEGRISLESYTPRGSVDAAADLNNVEKDDWTGSRSVDGHGHERGTTWLSASVDGHGRGEARRKAAAGEREAPGTAGGMKGWWKKMNERDRVGVAVAPPLSVSVSAR
ncbi:hypothetical protein DXG03_008299 [Asterophora parasitica]|uniref:C2 NT-type domain-containing protein n=1 Tax=Asterophora parasitica TaxID=117018 RepID=A0A9P7KBF3_9AGAR|nr:hypothetical protein DXG03_008299 [Asterophora parasitica]